MTTRIVSTEVGLLQRKEKKHGCDAAEDCSPVKHPLPAHAHLDEAADDRTSKIAANECCCVKTHVLATFMGEIEI